MSDKEIGAASDGSGPSRRIIEHLLEKSVAARNRGEWKIANDILFELRKISNRGPARAGGEDGVIPAR